MYSFDLNIIKRVKRYNHPCIILYPLLKDFFVVTFYLDNFVDEGLIIDVAKDLFEIIERSDPFIETAQSITKKIR